MNKITVLLIAFACLFAVGKAQTMPNPWVECGQDFKCGADKAGFDFPLKLENYTIRAMKGMFEIRYKIDAKREVIIRKVEEYDIDDDENGIKDISGDYNVYPVNKTIILDDVKFNVRGEKNNYKVVNFAAESGYYSFTCDEGLKLSDIKRLYDLLAEAEAPKE